MPGKVFLDTNVLVYAFDRSDPARHAAARNLVATLLDERRGVLSVQVLKEFYVVATRRAAEPADHATACRIINELRTFDVVEEGLAELDTALLLVAKYRISLWDALIVAAARSGGCTEICTEDLQDGQTIEGVTVRNPFLRRV